MPRMKPLTRVATTVAASLAAAVVAGHAPLAAAQSSCSSDGVARPTAVFERFISADCEACWADPATPAPGAAAVLLDWIVPTERGDDAPLSAAATNDAALRLQALGRPVPATTDVWVAAVTPPPARAGKAQRLRVALGLPLNDYVGTGIAFRPGAAAPAGDWHYHLLLVESVPAGSDGTAVPRNLVRNMLSGTWNQRRSLSKQEQSTWMDNRPMRVPPGAQPERLHMVGWVQDAQGHVVAAAQSVCR
jgi:hypothetical protein